jgi:ubiquinone/menaquinone biosynthesis C-methylase UbiE
MSQSPQPSPAQIFDELYGTTLFVPKAAVLLEKAAPRPGERVLDLACGTGTLARMAAPGVGPGGRVTAVDLNPNMLAVARSHPAPEGAPIEWREGNATALDLPDGSFDLVLCQQGMQFFPDRAAAAAEIRRVTAAGGRAALSTWQSLELHPVFQALVEAQVRRLGVDYDDMASPWAFPDGDALHALLSQAGFERVSVDSAVVPIYLPSAERLVYADLYATAALLPDFDWQNATARQELLAAILADMAPVIERYGDGQGLRFDAWLNIALAHA